MGLFSRRSKPSKDPHDWSALWSYLSSYSGRISANGAQLCTQYGRWLPEEDLRRAGRELACAYRLIDTEEHARHVGDHPWRGPEHLYSRARFLRAVDAVIVAGPDAIVRVRDEPGVIAEFDSGVVMAPYEEADPPGTLGTRLAAELEALDGDSEQSYLDMGDSFPWIGREEPHKTSSLDPEVGWVEAEVMKDWEEEAPGWRSACDIVQQQFFDLFGGANSYAISRRRLYIRGISGSPAEIWDDPDPDDDKITTPEVEGYRLPAMSRGDELQFAMSPQELAISDLNEQVRLLTWKASTLISAGLAMGAFEHLSEFDARLRALRDETASQWGPRVV